MGHENPFDALTGKTVSITEGTTGIGSGADKTASAIVLAILK
jgi:hypothetical protein